MHPTHAQVRAFIHTYTKPFFRSSTAAATSAAASSNPTKQEETSCDNSSLHQSKHHQHHNGLYRNPIHVHCGYKRELYPAYELLGPTIPEIPNKAYIEWGNGIKEYVDEVDVVRGELPVRSRKKTDRYEPVEKFAAAANDNNTAVEVNGGKEKKRKRDMTHDDMHFKPIQSDSSSDEEESCTNIFESDGDET
jgi:hypothetical protein